MAEFVPASKTQSNLNTVLGTIGTVGAAVNTMGSCGSFLGKLFGIGGNCNSNCNGNCGTCGNAGQTYVDALQAEVAELKAEKYANKAIAESYQAAVQMAEKLDSKWTVQLGEVTREVANSRVREAETKAKLECIEKTSVLQQQILEGKINEVALTASNGINTLTATVNCLANTLNSITKVVVPNASVCPGWGNVTITPAAATTTTTPAA